MLMTPLYAAILALLYVLLTFRTIWLRNKLQIALGDGENKIMRKAMRAHANFGEYIPLVLVLLFFVETLTRSHIWIHVSCGALILGRLVHAYGVSQPRENLKLRVFGMVCTISILIAAAVRLIVFYVASLS